METRDVTRSRYGSLVDFFYEFSSLKEISVIHTDGYRTRAYRYSEIARAAQECAHRLGTAGIGKGDAVLIWSENLPEWVTAFWGILLCRAVVVPVDYRSSADYLWRIVTKVKARGIFLGEEVQLAPRANGPDVPAWRLLEFCGLAKQGTAPTAPKAEETPGSPARPSPARDETVEIIFTSGATTEPKGVVITHRNILANMAPVEREISKYRIYGKVLFPLRFLNLLPLSHMFGQAMALFIPPLLPGTVFFMRGYSPGEIVRQIKARRLSFAVCVPRMLDMLREYVRQRLPEADEGTSAVERHWLRRRWHYRRLHGLFGARFWGFIVGAARLLPDLEEFWTRRAFVVIQGYGLTETAPIVTFNRRFWRARDATGTVGTPIEGVELKISAEGEILVRGENVTPGYFQAPEETAQAFRDGWFHTGDIGELDASGQLLIRGRKKEMIVTPEGVNVFPEDVERVLNQQPGVREAAVVGAAREGREEVHAVLVLEPGADAGEIVRRANALLEEQQRIRGISVWKRGPLPRTEGTNKLKRRELRRWVESGLTMVTATGGTASVADVLAKFAGQRTISAATTLEELGLSSLERIELLMALEDAFETTVDEKPYAEAQTVADLERLVTGQAAAAVRTPAGPQAAPDEVMSFPSWSRSPVAGFVRRIGYFSLVLPVTRLMASIRVEGLEHVPGPEVPVVFAANHQSHLDTPVIFAALPSARRFRLAPAALKEYFEAHFTPDQYRLPARLRNSLAYYLAALFFQVFPLPQRDPGARQTLRYIGELLSEGCSVLIYPEGTRSPSGQIAEFRAGVGMIASMLRVPVIPVRLEGLNRILPPGRWLPRPGAARVAFGRVLHLEGDDYPALARQVEEAVRSL